jgi:hypothetical protein
MDIDMEFEDDALLDFPIPEPTFTFQPEMPNGDFFSQEVISLGLQEPLPPDEMVEELYVSITPRITKPNLLQTPSILHEAVFDHANDTQEQVSRRFTSPTAHASPGRPSICYLDNRSLYFR